MSQDKLNHQNAEMLIVGAAEDARRIAYCYRDGAEAAPGIFWLSGFKSSMFGEKALALAEWAARQDHSCCRFDYSGHGLSGGAFEDGIISTWLEEAEAVFCHIAQGPQILVGSSMGGWIALLLARKLRKTGRITGIVLIAPAWDMTEKLMWQRCDQEAKKSIEAKGYFPRPSRYGDGDYIITKELIADGRRHLLDGNLLELGCPVHVLHGQEDPDVPWQHGHALTRLLPHDEVCFTLVPDGDHRLSRPQDIALLLKTIEILT